MVHEINSKHLKLPEVLSSSDVPTISTGCITEIKCDFYYELNWDFYFQQVFQCGPLKSMVDPCFGTKACVCDNGFFQM